jgi:CDP-paratose 2-epimerase
MTVPGIVEWFRPNEYERVEQVLDDLKALDVCEIRTGFSWADYHRPDGPAWYDWLLPRLARDVHVLPCFVYTPPSLGEQPKTSAPPRDLKAYADFLDVVVTRLGHCFEWVELWNEPNNLSEWDWRIDPGWNSFYKMINGAAYWMQQRGKKTVLGGPSPPDINWLRILGSRGLFEHIDAVGIHGFPGTWESDWQGWPHLVDAVRVCLEQLGYTRPVWITETGYSVWRYDEYQQLCAFTDALAAPVERMYWYAAQDLHPDQAHIGGFHEDERHYYFGIKDSQRNPRLLFRLWAEGGLNLLHKVAAYRTRGDARSTHPASADAPPEAVLDADVPLAPILITGGAGFLGTSLAAHLAREGLPVLIYDNLSRPGSEHNLRWLRATFGTVIGLHIADTRDYYALRQVVQQTGRVFHLAVHTDTAASLRDPVRDFEINLRGTLNVLEVLRAMPAPPPLVVASTSAPMPSLPGGCSQQAAENYVLSYARAYNLPASVLRMGTVYGPHQSGRDEHEPAARLVRQALHEQPLRLPTNGTQAADWLFIDDALAALLAAQQHIEQMSGRAFVVGGGLEHAASLSELAHIIADMHGRHLDVLYEHEEHAADAGSAQCPCVFDSRAFQDLTNWQPRVGLREGIARLYRWLQAQQTTEQHSRE